MELISCCNKMMAADSRRVKLEQWHVIKCQSRDPGSETGLRRLPAEVACVSGSPSSLSALICFKQAHSNILMFDALYRSLMRPAEL